MKLKNFNSWETKIYDYNFVIDLQFEQNGNYINNK